MIDSDELAGADGPRGDDPPDDDAAAGPRRLDGGYEVRVGAAGGLVAAHVQALRPPGAMRMAEGRTVPEAAGLAAMLYPMSATAQTAAALSAAEAALRVSVPPAQTAARQLLVGFEAAAACAWRMGLAWPQLAGTESFPEPARLVRAAADRAAEAIYADGQWARVGGGAVRPRVTLVLDLLDTVRRALRGLEGAVEGMLPYAPELRAPKDGWPLLDEPGVERAALALADDPGFAARPHLSGRAVEESPRALLQMWKLEDGLATWFRAQARFALHLPDRLDQAMRQLADADPAPHVAKGSGKGWGMAVTARGRIIHWLALDRGLVRAWRTIEPTDWNFSPRGPVTRAIELLDPDGDLAEGARWAVAALDPSAPCRIALETEPPTRLIEHRRAAGGGLTPR